MSRSPYRPAWWLPGPHLQTLWPALCRRKLPLTLTRERLELPDGDFIDLDWTPERDAPIVIVLHGLEGSLDSHYARGMLNAIHAQNWRGVFMHFRSCSEEMNRHIRAYHSGETGDLATLVSVLRDREPGVPLAAIGYSLGGNVLLKWLGETGSKNPLAAAAAISVPFELARAARRINQGFSRVYEIHFLQSLREKIKKKFAQQNAPFSLDTLKKIHSMYEFDDQITAVLHGFANADDYYKRCSSRQFLKLIKVPTLLLQAKDDPFMTPDVIPDLHELSETVQLEVTENGGHAGFVTGDTPWGAQYWPEIRVPEFLREQWRGVSESRGMESLIFEE